MDFANTPSFFSSGPRTGSRLAICVLLSIALLVGDSQYGLMDRARNALSVALFPLQWAVNAPLRVVGRVGDFFVSQATLQAENAELKSRQLELRAQLARSQSLQRDLNELKALNGLRMTRLDQGKIAEVLYTGRDPFSYKIIIDKGADAGLANGQAVLDDTGLIGQVTRVQPLTAEVTLLVDKNMMVPVMVERTGQRTLVYGFGGGIEVRYLAQHADIRPGDRLLTSGIDGLYPAGLPVASVVTVERSPASPFVRVVCSPLGGVEQSRYALVLPTRVAPAPPPPAPAPAAPKPKKSSDGD